MNRKIEQYSVVYEQIHQLAEAVEKAIGDGWQPYGSPFASGDVVCQAVVQYEEDDEKDFESSDDDKEMGG